MNKALKKEIKEYKKNYKEENTALRLYHIIVNHPNTIMLKAIICSKKYRYYKENHKRLLNKLKMIYYGRKNNKYANIYNVEIYGKFGKNLKIYHRKYSY